MSYDYNYYGSNYGSSGDLAALGGLVAVISIISLAVAIFSIIVMWKMFKKAGKPGWAAIVPFYNTYVLFEITWGNGWYFLLLFTSIIPVIGYIACLVIIIITMVKLAKAFGKSGGFAVGLIFLSVIFMAILAFDKSTYLGVPASGSNMAPAGPPVPPQDGFQNAGPTYTPQNDITASPVNEPSNSSSQQGNAQAPITGYCVNCGAPLPEGTVFCPNCGNPKAS